MMYKMKTTRIQKETTEIIELNKQDILDYLEIEDAEVFVQVPGGADWSNEELDIEEGCPIVVKVKHYEEEYV